MPDGHSRVEPPLPIPNRTVKRLCADDSADSRVKVGHCQAFYCRNAQPSRLGVFLWFFSTVMLYEASANADAPGGAERGEQIHCF